MTEIDHLEDNFKLYRQGKCGGVDWIDLAQDSDKRRAVVNTVMNFDVSVTVHHIYK